MVNIEKENKGKLVRRYGPRLDYQPLFGKMSPPGRRRKSSLIRARICLNWSWILVTNLFTYQMSYSKKPITCLSSCFFTYIHMKRWLLHCQKILLRNAQTFKKNLIQLQNPITYLAFRRPIEFVFPYVYFKTIKIDIVYERIFLRNAHTSKTVSIQKPEYYFNVLKTNHWGKFIQRPS